MADRLTAKGTQSVGETVTSQDEACMRWPCRDIAALEVDAVVVDRLGEWPDKVAVVSGRPSWPGTRATVVMNAAGDRHDHRCPCGRHPDMGNAL